MSNLLIALQITALGMGLVFAAILVLWWMMALLTSVMAEKETFSEDNTVRSVSMEATSARNHAAQAAAVAVAIALAEQEARQVIQLSVPPTATVSAWQLGMRTRQLYQKGTPLIRKPRKVG